MSRFEYEILDVSETIAVSFNVLDAKKRHRVCFDGSRSLGPLRTSGKAVDDGATSRFKEKRRACRANRQYLASGLGSKFEIEPLKHTIESDTETQRTVSKYPNII